jgi:hypothetical protein
LFKIFGLQTGGNHDIDPITFALGVLAKHTFPSHPRSLNGVYVKRAVVE